MPLPTRGTLLGYGLLALVIVVLGVRWLQADAAQAPRAADPAQRATRDEPVLDRAPEPAAVVHVAGAVRRPGVYRLPAGSRVRDAMRRAGGATRTADTAAINLAAKLADGQQVIVPRRIRPGAIAPGAGAPGTGAAGGVAGSAPSGPVSLGSATLEQLDALDGVGPATARKILDFRTQNGGFSSVDDLGEIPGIGPKKLESLRRQVTP